LKPLSSTVPACTNCWNLFSISPDISHHELLGLPYEPNPFVVDLDALKQRFRQAQAACHPDTWASRGPVRVAVPYHLKLLVDSLNRISRTSRRRCQPG
jgi:molecular chaperone HscB